MMRQLKIMHKSSLIDERRQAVNESENYRMLDEGQRKKQIDRLDELNISS